MFTSIPSDGLPYTDASDVEPMRVGGVALTIDALERAHPGFGLCEHCHRIYSAEIPFCGAPAEQCVHCVFESLHQHLEEDAADAEVWEALEADGLPSLAAYVQAFTPPHEEAACRRRPHCFLCDAARGGAPLASLEDLERWLEDRGFAPLSDEPLFDPEVLDGWLQLSRGDQRRALTALQRALDLVVCVGESAEGVPVLRHPPSGVELAVVPRQGRTRAFLLATSPLSAGQAAALGMPTGTLDPTMPWTGFDVEQLVNLWSWGFRLPLVEEWELASRAGSGPASLFVCERESPAPVERSPRAINKLGLADLAGQVAELVGIREDAVVTLGGSHRSAASALAPLSVDAPVSAAKRRARVQLEEHPIQTLGSLLPSVVPSHVGIRLALDILPRT